MSLFSHASFSASSYIQVNVSEQTLRYFKNNQLFKEYTIATAKNGLGEKFGSECTPRGWHQVRAKIGHNCSTNTVFIARRPTGEVYSSELKKQHPDRDWILTRIMWLSGLEVGNNRLGNIDTMRRYIYIHGCPDEDKMGIPSSHGCIKMRNTEVIELFDLISVGIKINIC